MSASRRTAHLDPRSPFVLDTRELGRRPGSMRRVQRSVPAPGDWGLELVRVPAGSDVVLDLRLEAVMDGVLVSGTVRTSITAECGRCLDPLTDVVDTEVQELFAYDPAEAGEGEPVLDGDLLDLAATVRDAVVLGLPLNPVCDDACAGLCATCGARFAEVGPEHGHDDVDPRWAALASLRGDQNPRRETEN
jgi:uncharacterized protein